MRLTAELSELARRASAEGLPGTRPRRLPGKTAARIVEIASELRLKPRKGRIKDLARIDRALEQMLKLADPNHDHG